MTAYTRYISRDSDRPPLEFGVRIDRTNPDPGAAVTRLGDAAAMAVNTATSPHVSDFSNFYPWKGMRRCNLNSIQHSEITAYYGEVDESENALYSDSAWLVAVEIPKFWIKFVYGATYNEYWISPFPLPGYRLPPAFIRNKLPVEYIYMGAFEGYLLGGYLYSTGNVAPTGTQTRAQFRTAATTAPGGSLGLTDIQTWAVIQWLWLVEYAYLDFQTPSGSAARGGLSPGIITGAKVNTGWTSGIAMGGGSYTNHDLGNFSGQVEVDAGRFAMSYRGVENLVGNLWECLDGHCIDTSKNIWMNYNTLACNDYTTAQLVDPGTNTTYQKIGVTVPTSSDYIKTMAQSATHSEPEWGFFPSSVSGGSITTYWCDKFYTNANDSYLAAGAAYLSGTKADGLFGSLQSVLAGTSPAIGARLMFVPQNGPNYTPRWFVY